MHSCHSTRYKTVLHNLDKIIAITILIFSAIIIILSISKRHYGIHIPSTLLFSSTIYLLFRDKKNSHENIPVIFESNRLSVIANIFFFSSITMLLWLSWSNLYYRPPLYFIFILVAASSIIINIFSLNDSRISNIAIVLIKITTLSYIIYASIYYQFEGIYGTDPWLHNNWIQGIINTGHLIKEPMFLHSYYIFPIFHLNSTITSVTTTLSIYHSLFVSIGFLMAMSGTFIFIISRTVIDTKAGLLAALIVPLIANNIEKATELIPMSLGYILFLLIFCLIFHTTGKRVENKMLLIILSMIAIFTHTIAALATLLVLIIIFGAIKLYNAIMKDSISTKVLTLPLILLFAVTMINRWMVNPPGNSSFFNYQLTGLMKSLQLDAQFALEAPPVLTSMPYKVVLFDQAGHLLLFTFAIIGALNLLKFKKWTLNGLILIFIAGFIFIFINAFSMLQLANILPYRWYPFWYVPLSTLAIAGILWVSNLIKNKTGRLVFVMLVILVIIFSMTSNSLANKDSPFMFNNAVRYGYTQSEFAAIDTLSNINPGRFVTDIYFSVMFPYVLSDDKYNEMMRSDKSVFIQRNYYLNNPEWVEKYKISIVTGNERNIITKNVLISNYMKEKYSIHHAPMMYNNGNVKVYII